MTHWHNIRPQSDDAQGINKLFIGSLRLMKTKLTRFPPSCRVNLLGHVFLKGINHYCLHFSFLLVFFFFFVENDVFSEWWNWYFRDTRNPNFVCSNPMTTRRNVSFIYIIWKKSSTASKTQIDGSQPQWVPKKTSPKMIKRDFFLNF